MPSWLFSVDVCCEGLLGTENEEAGSGPAKNTKGGRRHAVADMRNRNDDESA